MRRLGRGKNAGSGTSSDFYFNATRCKNISVNWYLLKNLNLVAIWLALHNHPLQIFRFSVKRHTQSHTQCVLHVFFFYFIKMNLNLPVMLSFLVRIHVLQLVQLRLQDGDVRVRLQQSGLQLLVFLWGHLATVVSCHVTKSQVHTPPLGWITCERSRSCRLSLITSSCERLNSESFWLCEKKKTHSASGF